VSSVTLTHEGSNPLDEASMAIERAQGVLKLIDDELDGIEAAAASFTALGTIKRELELADAWIDASRAKS
jgi:hypothetical protein